MQFANRIPLLFEGGADVDTRIAQLKIKWSSYEINHKKDQIGIFVSIVPTNIPFKGTGKEYTGDNIIKIQNPEFCEVFAVELLPVDASPPGEAERVAGRQGEQIEVAVSEHWNAQSSSVSYWVTVPTYLNVHTITDP